MRTLLKLLCWLVPMVVTGRFAELNLFPDEEHAPFLHGVASGDPLQDSVLIWTRLDSGFENDNVAWALWAEGGSFEDPVQNGTEVTSRLADHTLTVDVSGLSPDSRYFYQFEASSGSRSVVGRTKTLPPTTSFRDLNIAVTSCTKVQEGYLNQYAHMAQQDDLDLVLHLGDLIYPQCEENRYLVGVCDNKTEFNFWKKCDVVSGKPEDNGLPYLADMARNFTCEVGKDLERYRWTHQFYHMDPEFRLARQNHAWIVLYDNHDIKNRSPLLEDSMQAFLEWVPMRYQVNSTDNTVKSNRKFHVGGLVDIFTLDTQVWDTEDSLLGPEQELWIDEQLKASSNATWRFILNPKMLVPYSLSGFPEAIQLVFFMVWSIFLVLFLSCVGGVVHNHKKQAKMSVLDVSSEEGAPIKDPQIGRIKRAFREIQRAPKPLRICTWTGFVMLILWSLTWIILGVMLATLPILGGSGNPDELVYLDDGKDAWGGRFETLNRVFDSLESAGHKDNFFLTGDMHFTVFADVFRFDENDEDSILDYDEDDTDVKRVGVEFLSSSGSSGNIDERIERELGVSTESPFNQLLASTIQFLTRRGNPHMRYFNGIDHGYGILRVTENQVKAQQFYHDKTKLDPSSNYLAKEMTCSKGKQKWNQD